MLTLLEEEGIGWVEVFEQLPTYCSLFLGLGGASYKKESSFTKFIRSKRLLVEFMAGWWGRNSGGICRVLN